MNLFAAALTSEQPKLRLVLLHGYGSNERDMAGLGEELPEDVDVICLRAPQAMAYGGYAWFDIVVSGEQFSYDEDQFRSSLALLLTDLKELRLPNVPFVIGGFSQGAMMSAAALLIEPSLDGAWLMSGACPPLETLPESPSRPVLAQHGTDDSILTIERGRDLATRLESAGMAVTRKEYPMGHSVSAESLADGLRWLSQFLAN